MVGELAGAKGVRHAPTGFREGFQKFKNAAVKDRAVFRHDDELDVICRRVRLLDPLERLTLRAVAAEKDAAVRVEGQL